MIVGLQIGLLLLTAIAISAAIFSVIWFLIRAACRKAGLVGRYLIFVPSAVFAIPVLLLLIASVDRLDPLERTCRAASLASPQLQDVANLHVQEHYDFWTKTYSGSSVYPWISRPYEMPKVSLLLNFKRDQRSHLAWVHCVFEKIPNTGEPPQLALLNFYVSENGGGFAPWMVR
jgi:hypothetical protein